MRYSPLDVVRGLINLFVGLAEVILGLRIVLRLFAANPDSDFVQWIYDSSGSLIAPFRGIFPTAQIDPGHVLDFTALFAMVIYGLLGFLLLYLLALLAPAPAKRVR